MRLLTKLNQCGQRACDGLLSKHVLAKASNKHAKGYVGAYNEDLESLNAVMAWNGVGDKQSFIDGWKLRAKRERTFK